MSTRVALLAVLLSFIAVPSTAQIFSWDPLKDVENALPQGVPNEGKIIQARQQVREMAQDALATLYETAPLAHRAVDRAAGYATFSTFGIKLFFAGGTTAETRPSPVQGEISDSSWASSARWSLKRPGAEY